MRGGRAGLAGIALRPGPAPRGVRLLRRRGSCCCLRLAGAVNNFLYWITNPVWIGGTLTITCISAVEVFFNHGANVSTPVWFIIALAFVWLSILAAIMSFSKAKWLPTAGAFARFIVLGVFTLSVIIFAFKHGAHGLGASGYKPSESGFVLLVGVLLFNFVGFELPSSAARR